MSQTAIFTKLIRIRQTILAIRVIQAMTDFIMIYGFIAIIFANGRDVPLFTKTFPNQTAMYIILAIAIIDISLSMIRRNDLRQGRDLASNLTEQLSEEQAHAIRMFKVK